MRQVGLVAFHPRGLIMLLRDNAVSLSVCQRQSVVSSPLPTPAYPKLFAVVVLSGCSGGQYRDGTTDVTRTVHFGTPTKHEITCNTLVLKGHIAIATV